jgi:tRNA G10  N-methylase Trm11
MNELRAICARLAGNELVAAECQNLTGSKPDPCGKEYRDGVAVCQTLESIPRSAYISLGLRCLAEAETFEALIEQIRQSTFPADRFRVEFLRLSGQPFLQPQEAILAAANATRTYPDLDAPLHRFLIVVQEERFWFGEILAEGQHTYVQHDAKPYRTSNSLPSRLARALVNLVSPPARSILDPLCGTGSILLEAQALGLTAYGIDWNPKMVFMSRRNLEHFGYTVEVMCGNALDCQRTADAIVTDLPYGRSLKMDREKLLPIIQQAKRLAPQAVYLAEQDVSAWLEEAGYQEIEVFRVRKRAGMSRYVHRGVSGFFATSDIRERNPHA